VNTHKTTASEHDYTEAEKEAEEYVRNQAARRADIALKVEMTIHAKASQAERIKEFIAASGVTIEQFKEMPTYEEFDAAAQAKADRKAAKRTVYEYISSGWDASMAEAAIAAIDELRNLPPPPPRPDTED
jgi:hypothetical protein